MKRTAVIIFALSFLVILSSCAKPSYKFTKVKKTDKAEVLLKYQKYTGETWYYSHPDWVMIDDEVNVPKSIYSVKGKANSKGGWSLYRLDRNTGESWISIGNKWKKIGESPDNMTKTE